MLIKNMNEHSPFILNKCVIIPLKILLINSGNPYLIRRFDKTKNGNKDGKILFLKMFKEKITDFKILSESFNISKHIKSSIIIIIKLWIFFIISPKS